MKDFIQKNFPELLLTFLILIIGIVMLFSIHWHADHSVTWCEGMIAGIVLALTTTLNSLRAPHASGPNSTVSTLTSTESVKSPDPNAKETT